ncbi:NADPH-dependent FMN reductase [Sporosarcina highlanderae]|uniref:NAD(P)H-dependent oxidoreductase n=1 Tax=Sporosarcina highlanderae TaxID=3035916 RepID=A0ABT8JRA5_9BACL|nr:NADPH-dependent FMN reductase [Sporosarcina highlanderae]MDN4607700.1 NAD(P)H-dependent oxidoreductase [Sporosarcina highlanderae]
MKIVALSGSIVGSKTKTAMLKTVEMFKQKYPEHEVTLLDLAEYKVEFSDGRNYFEYEGDTKYVTETIMAADAIIIGTPVFQASIPATLKNIFDLLPVNAFRDKVVSIVVTAGTAKHYLMVEQQLKPVLAYMKAHIVPTYVFIEEKDFLRKEIVNDDILFRLERLVEDTVVIVDAFKAIRMKKDEEYDF